MNSRFPFSLRAILFALAGLAVLFVPIPALAKPVDRVLRVEAGNSAFTPAVFQVNPGDRVTVELVSTDVAHGFTIDGYSLDLRAEPGQTARGTFTAGRAGSFKIRCSIGCGNLHPFMTGRFEVGPNLILLRAAGLAILASLAGILRWKHA